MPPKSHACENVAEALEYIEAELGTSAAFIPPVMVTPLQSDDEQASGFLVTSGEYSENEPAQHEIERGHTEKTFRRLLASARGAMVIVDGDGKIVLANAQTESLFGYTPEELTGRGVDTLIPKRYHAQHTHHKTGFFGDPRARPMGTGLDLWAIRKDGTELPVEISISPIETEQGVLAAAEIRDVTERRRFELELQETNTQLAAASQAKDRFLASMSHELRTPLNAVIGFTGTILMGLSGPLTAEQRKQLETVKTNGKQLLAIINDLLDLAQIESGKVELTFEPVDGRTLLEEVVSGLRPVAAAKGIDLQVTMVEPTVTLHTDRRALSQILINLTNNAIKYTDEGSVRIDTDICDTDDGPVTRFTVVDTGLGIKEEDRVRLFTAFQQVEPSATRRHEGTGLGLYISQKLAVLIHGTLNFESEYGAGSRFVLEVPRGAEE